MPQTKAVTMDARAVPLQVSLKKRDGLSERGQPFSFCLLRALHFSFTSFAPIIFLLAQLVDTPLLLAFSTAATTKWFWSASASFYLLGFYGFENSFNCDNSLT
jgi:hypothetical protein